MRSQDGCSGFSVAMVQSWIDGATRVQSRLVVDVRDCAQAHINAATTASAAGKRYIVSTEARVPAAECAEVLRARLRANGRADAASRINADEDFDGGAVPVGEREVAAEVALSELGVECRAPAATLSDMAAALLGEPVDGGIDARDEAGETRLIRTAEAADAEGVAALLAMGADPCAVSRSGWTALHGAAESGCVEAITALVAAGADMSATAASGKTPLDIAWQYEQPAAASALAERGAVLGAAPGARGGHEA